VFNGGLILPSAIKNLVGWDLYRSIGKKEILIDAIEAALLSAYKKNFGTSQNVQVNIDKSTGVVKVYAMKTIVDEVVDESQQIYLEDAQRIDPVYKLGDVVKIEVTPKNFGRIAAQNAKQVVVQRIREAERALIYQKFIEKEDEIMTCVIQRAERRNVFVDIDGAEATMPPNEQVLTENYQVNDRLMVYITEVKMTNKGPQITVSRTHPNLVKRLFEREVPEIIRGEVIIKDIAREAGSRTKMAVFTHHPSIDPIGACVGQHGIRVQHVVDELKGEKIDIIKWSDDPREYIGSALSPARILNVQINELEKSARVVVPDNQLSLAIGKEGQNARLAAKLTGWKIDIKSISQMDNIDSIEDDNMIQGDDVL
jgi:N utilization substance protein A